MSYLLRTLLLLLIFLIPDSCTKAVQKGQTPVSGEGQARPSVKEQWIRATEEFKGVLELVENSRSRLEVLPEIEERYLEIIKRYPDAPLSQEIHWMLVKMYLRDFDPPRVDDAERTYQRFIKRYPDSPFRASIEDTLTRFYHRNRMWDRIIMLNKARVESFITTGKVDKPYLLLLYAEALENLGREGEAVEIYNALIRNFPNSSVERRAKKQMERLDTH